MKKSVFLILIFVLSFGCNNPFLETNLIPSNKKQNLEVMLLIDQTGSFNSSSAVLKNEFNLIKTDCKIGIAGFADFPISPYGSVTDFPYTLFLPLSDNTSDINNAIQIIPNLIGGDTPEDQYEALYQAATGIGFEPYISATKPGWTKDSKKLIILITDAVFHNDEGYPGHKLNETLNILNKKNFIVDGIALKADACNDLNNITDSTGGNVYNLSASGAGIFKTIQDAIFFHLNEL